MRRKAPHEVERGRILQEAQSGVVMGREEERAEVGRRCDRIRGVATLVVVECVPANSFQDAGKCVSAPSAHSMLIRGRGP